MESTDDHLKCQEKRITFPGPFIKTDMCVCALDQIDRMQIRGACVEDSQLLRLKMRVFQDTQDCCDSDSGLDEILNGPAG